MRRTEVHGILSHSVRQSLETMCFSEAQPVDDSFDTDDVIATRVKFHGSLSGCLRLETSAKAANRLAASFLGLAQLASESALAKDTVCELGNVICGRFLSLLEPAANLIIEVSRAAERAGADVEGQWQNFRADSGVLRVAVEFDSTNFNDCR